jgi:hypothetical protein
VRTASPFAAPKPRKPPKVKRDTPDEAVERRHVWMRDHGCVVRHLRAPKGIPLNVLTPCDGPLSYDHVRASGGLGMKSPTHRTNGVILCLHHHNLKTDWGKTWRPLLLDYLARVEPAE